MDILSTVFNESTKRYWRRRRYQRLSGGAPNNKKKLKIRRLGGSGHRLWKIKLIPKFQLSIASPVKLLVKFHDAYIDMMIRLVGNAGNSSNIGLFGGQIIPRGPHISMVSTYEKMDNRLVLEINKRLATSPPVSAFWSNFCDTFSSQLFTNHLIACAIFFSFPFSGLLGDSHFCTCNSKSSEL